LTGFVTDFIKRAGFIRRADGGRPLGLPGDCALLLVSVVVAYGVVGMIAGGQHGSAGWLAAAIAAATCWFASALALVASNIHQGPLRGFYSLLYGALLGFSIPFGAGLVLNRSAPRLSEAGIFGLMVVFYLFTLAVGTALTVRRVSVPADSVSRESRIG
jgi:hypothetical protein